MIHFSSASDLVKLIKSNDNVFIHSGVSSPQNLIKAMADRAPELKSVKIYQIHTEGNCDYAKPSLRESFLVNNFFNGENMRHECADIIQNYIPIFLSEIPNLFYSGAVPLDVAMIQVSPPDKHGMVSLGASVDISISAVRTAKKVIAEVNPNVPRTFGDAQIHISKIYGYIESNRTLFEIPPGHLSPEEELIGKHVAELVEDGATLQMGIGAIPNAVLKCLTSHKDLGVHTEMFSDGLVDLYELGVVNGRLKKKHPEKIVSSFVIGSKKVYDFIDDNPAVLLLDCAYTNSTYVIKQNQKVTAINSAIEVDLTGQVCADSIGSRIYSGVGGQMDFIRGASLSEGGKPIIALPSQTNKGLSKIVPTLKLGAGVVTTRAHVHYIATEYGVADLFGMNIRERVKALINISHPDHRENLEREAHALFKFS
jgi:4-hydroxybutyrate CoA-transferase